MLRIRLANLAWIAVAGLLLAAEARGQSSGAKTPSDAEIDALAGAEAFGKRIEEAIQREPVAPNGVRARFANARYGPDPRHVFDLWTVKSDRPAPLAVFIHGGGFRRGDKALVYDSTLLASLLDAGVAVAAINYRFSDQTDEGTLGSIKDAARFVQFIRANARDYGVDPARIAAWGGSAGAATSLWLAFHDDLADPSSPDPVARQSTRLACAGAMATPSTLDYLKWPAIFEMSLERIVEMSVAYGFERDDETLRSERGTRLRAATDMLALMSADDPPFFVHNNEEGGPPRHYGHMAHHPYHARELKKRAEEVGVRAAVHAPRIGIEDPAGGNLAAFFVGCLQPAGGK